jgi:hypothetical protein
MESDEASQGKADKAWRWPRQGKVSKARAVSSQNKATPVGSFSSKGNARLGPRQRNARQAEV